MRPTILPRAHESMRLRWIGEPGYPMKLARRMGSYAPRRIYVSGCVDRLERPLFGVVGSRSIGSDWASATRRLAHGLCSSNWTLITGLARGADWAAFQGGAMGSGGVVGVPARGTWTEAESLELGRAVPKLTLLSVVPPGKPFNSGYAVQRNEIIGALADAMLLVAAEAKSGSWYAVRRALRDRVPIYAFDSGPSTPVGNRWLIERKHATPLPVHASGEVFESVLESLERSVDLSRRDIDEAPGFL